MISQILLIVGRLASKPVVHATAAVATLFIQTVFYCLVFTPGYSLAMDLADAAIRARTAALISMGATAIGYGLGPQIVGLLSDVLEPLAGGQSLRFAIVTMMFAVLWCGAHFTVACRILRGGGTAKS